MIPRVLPYTKINGEAKTSRENNFSVRKHTNPLHTFIKWLITRWQLILSLCNNFHSTLREIHFHNLLC